MEPNPQLDDTDNFESVDKWQGEDRAKPCAENGHKCRPSGKDEDETSLECPVCLQTCIYPVQLPCRHIFCFLCVKGVASRSKRCALCRQQIPPDFFCRPNLVRRDDLEQTLTFDDGYGWFYEGVNGWWQYDDRTSRELEFHHKAGHSSCELLIAGYVYLIDLTNMFQLRRNDRTKKRRIKRDLVNIPGRKGVAGLKITSGSVVLDSDRPGADGHETVSSSTSSGSTRQTIPIRQVDRSGDHQSLSPPTPHNTPQTPMTPSESPPSSSSTTERDLSVHLERLRLVDSGPVSISPVGSSAGPSSRGYDTPEQLSNSMEDATRLENVRASLQQLQSTQGNGQVVGRPGLILRSENDIDAEEIVLHADCESGFVQV
ncbi:E3 ubiquitin-protein ligase rnf146-like [Plakobranchus ocellatus]|uniref:E3 ubiquitin-protein ligase n=1 Tax=Plakobranchus ocellatus TaxID=259542 RepID=A0AAV3Y3M9_9GAST|nr:E3 ubiquitin-protein ligase rnf146-like [Plakobranchus ocellatus]